jgi:cytochrome c oxidase cbb3-type subunit 3
MKLCLLALPALVLAQNPHQPLIGDPNAEGESIYRSNCAFCHGVTGKGGRGPDLTGRRNHGDSLADVKRVVQQGIPGTTMPAFANLMDDELDRLAEYVQKFTNAGAATAKLTGDPVAGKRIYDRSGCVACHAINGAGSIYGPDLSRIGAARSSDYIRDSIVKPSADIPQEWEGVTAVLTSGQKVTGIRVNEDTFTLQMRDPSGAFRLFDKGQLASVVNEKKSLMPAYDRLSAADLDNLLAYLDTLRTDIAASGPASKAKGIH